jgi:hypothetical protein
VDAPVEDLHDKIEEEIGIPLDPDQISLLKKHRFNSELERLMTEHVESVMMLPGGEQSQSASEVRDRRHSKAGCKDRTGSRHN